LFYLSRSELSFIFEDNDQPPFYQNDFVDIFPEITDYPMRRDVYTNEEVSTGRLDLIGGLNTPSDLSLKDFRKALQCPTKESHMLQSHGFYENMKSIPMTNDLLLNICAYCETTCKLGPDCRKLVPKFLNGSYPTNLGRILNSPFHARLLRVIGGELYFDWPWGTERFNFEVAEKSNMLGVLINVLKKVGHLLGDSAFIVAAEIPTSNGRRIPFPILSESSSMDDGDLVVPWQLEMVREMHLYKKYKSDNRDLNHKYEDLGDKGGGNPWVDRIPKAAVFGTLTRVRAFAYDLSRLRPDLIDAGYTNRFNTFDMSVPWSPYCKRETFIVEHSNSNDRTDMANRSIPLLHDKKDIGCPASYTPLFITHGIEYQKEYKYVVVLLGCGGLATANRLAALLTYSGAVVLLQESKYYYHFSGHLKPWVHYIPVSYNLADMITKIEWLEANDDKAQQIIRNAKIFGRSHLRIEDYYCYYLNMMESLGGIMGNTTAATPSPPAIPYPVEKAGSDFI
jgi:hypothetical protein